MTVLKKAAAGSSVADAPAPLRRRRLGALALAAALLLAGGGVATAGCGKGIRFGNMMSTSQEVELGKDVAQQIEKESKIVKKGPQYDQLQRVAARILPLAKKDYDVPYSVKLIDSKEVNAFALPGGPIYFYKGLMDIADDDDQIAAVLSHESTHVVRRHAAKQISDAQAKGLLAQLLLLRAAGPVQSLASIGLQIDQLHYSRDDEAEADRNGFRYLTAAHYDPAAMAQVFQKLEEKEGKNGGGPEWLQNHPLTRKRVENAQAWAAAYEKNGALPQ